MRVVDYLKEHDDSVSEEILMYLSKYGSKNLDLDIDVFINKINIPELNKKWEDKKNDTSR